jgi:predicted dehydrogenase
MTLPIKRFRMRRFHMASPPVTICTLGLSDYLRRYALPGLMRANGCDLRAIAVRDIPKARRALGDVDVPLIDSYEEALARPEVQAVYIMLPNALHMEWVMRSIRAGKHVLCEKPMALSVEDIDEIERAAASHGVNVMEGYMYRFHPQWAKVTSILRTGTIGRVRSVIGHYAYLDQEFTESRFAPGSGGGVLRLVGCYIVSAARLAFESEPGQAVGCARYRVEGDIDQTFSGVLTFSDGHATVHASVETFDTQYLRVMGETGMIEMRLPWNPAATDDTIISVTNSVGLEELSVAPADQFQLEFEHFARLVRGDEEPLVPLSESRLNTAAVEALRNSALRVSRPLATKTI